MDALLVALSRSVALRQVPERVLRASLPLWSVVDLRPGVLLWKQGRPADSLGIVIAGELDVVVDGTVIGQVEADEMIGEGAIFQREAARIASLRAGQRTQVVVLWSAGLRQLRGEHGPLYAAIVQHALQTAVHRGRALERRLVEVREANFVPPESPGSSGLLAKLWTLLRPEPDPAGCPSLAPLLVGRPPLAQAAEAEREAVLRAFVPLSFRAGELLAREGEVDERVLVLATGAADCLRGQHELLGHLRPGTIVGVDGFAAGVPATASVVASDDGWVHALTREAFERLPASARSLAQELALAAALERCHAAAHALQGAIAMFAARHEEPLAPSVLAAR